MLKYQHYQIALPPFLFVVQKMKHILVKLLSCSTVTVLRKVFRKVMTYTSGESYESFSRVEMISAPPLVYQIASCANILKQS